MKRTYTKPTLYAESFELSEHIASCKANQDITTVTYRDGNSCTYTDANLTLFYTDNSACLNQYFNLEDYDSFDDYLASFAVGRGGCYNAFTDGNFFAS